MRKFNLLRNSFEADMQHIQSILNFFQWLEDAQKSRQYNDKQPIDLAALRKDGRRKNIVAARMLISVYLYDECLWSFHKIGKWMNRDHSSIVYLVSQYREQINGALPHEVKTWVRLLNQKKQINESV